MGEQKQDEGCEGKLHEHVDAGRKQGEVEIEVLWVEHPLIILRYETLAGVSVGRIGLTMDIDNEKRYHNPIKNPLIKRFFTTF